MTSAADGGQPRRRFCTQVALPLCLVSAVSLALHTLSDAESLGGQTAPAGSPVPDFREYLGKLDASREQSILSARRLARFSAATPATRAEASRVFLGFYRNVVRRCDNAMMADRSLQDVLHLITEHTDFPEPEIRTMVSLYVLGTDDTSPYDLSKEGAVAPATRRQASSDASTCGWRSGRGSAWAAVSGWNRRPTGLGWRRERQSSFTKEDSHEALSARDRCPRSLVVRPAIGDRGERPLGGSARRIAREPLAEDHQSDLHW